MDFTAKWLLPPLVLFVIAGLNLQPHHEASWAKPLGAIALVWFGWGVRACRLYWRSRFRARGWSDGYRRR
jgi:hypothetical protein